MEKEELKKDEKTQFDSENEIKDDQHVGPEKNENEDENLLKEEKQTRSPY